MTCCINLPPIIDKVASKFLVKVKPEITDRTMGRAERFDYICPSTMAEDALHILVKIASNFDPAHAAKIAKAILKLCVEGSTDA